MIMQITVKQLLEAGVHFGHKTQRWNPKMSPFIYEIHKGVHIIDLPKTVEYMKKALDVLYNVAKDGGRILFVGTKPQAKEAIKSVALSCGQYYINHRWLGGTLTNWKTISNSIKRMKTLKEKMTSPEFSGYTKKEKLDFQREVNRLENVLGGIKDMGDLPDILFVIDTNKEMIAIKEAMDLNIPIVAIIDTNCNPDNITYPIPGNDDALKSIQFYCDVAAQAIIEGIQAEMQKSGTDIGERKDVPSEHADPLLKAFEIQENPTTEHDIKSEKTQKEI